jgi:hypothetical protein
MSHPFNYKFTIQIIFLFQGVDELREKFVLDPREWVANLLVVLISKDVDYPRINQD